MDSQLLKSGIPIRIIIIIGSLILLHLHPTTETLSICVDYSSYYTLLQETIAFWSRTRHLGRNWSENLFAA